MKVFEKDLIPLAAGSSLLQHTGIMKHLLGITTHIGIGSQ